MFPHFPYSYDDHYKICPKIIEKLKSGDVENVRNTFLLKEIDKVYFEPPELTHEIFNTLGYALQKTKVTTLSIPNSKLGSFAITLAQALQDTPVHTLRLEDCNIAEHTPAMVRALQHTQVHTLNLHSNQIGKHAPAMAEALQNTCIHTLELTHNNIAHHTLAMVKALRNTSVSFLYLGNNNIYDDILVTVEALQHTQVHTLDLFCNCIIDDAAAIIQALKNTRIHTLGLENNMISKYAPAMGQALQNARIHTLCLSENYIKAADANLFAQSLKNTPVRNLDFSHHFIRENAPKFIQALSESNVINLAVNYSNIEGYHAVQFFQALQGTKIRKLNFEANSIEPEFLEPIVEALANTSICDLKGIREIDLPKIEPVILENRRRIYTQRLHTAEYQGTLLKNLYQETFPWNVVTFPTSIARLIMIFLGYGDDQNLRKRFLNKLKLHSTSTLTANADVISAPLKPTIELKDDHRVITKKRKRGKLGYNAEQL